MQAGRRHRNQHLLELAKGPSCLAGLFRRFDAIDGVRPVDEPIGAPEFSAAVNVPGLAIASGDQSKCASAVIGMACNLAGQVQGYALDVLHERDRAFEDTGVDALQQDALERVSVLECHSIGIVDVATAANRSARELTFNCERLRYGLEFGIAGHCASDFG
jgi:hypothetical protein